MKQFQNILVTVDTRGESHPALHWAAALAEHNQARLTLLEIVPEFSWLVRTTMSDHERIRELLAQEKAEKLESLAGPLRQQGIEVITKVNSGKTSFQVIYEVMRQGHDLVVNSTKGTYSRRSGFFGTTSRRLLRRCPCAVWLVKPNGPPRFTNVLAAVEPSLNEQSQTQLNDTIMELATSIAAYEKGNCHVVHAWEMYGASILKSHMSPEEFENARQQAATKATAALDALLARYHMSSSDQFVHLLEGEPHRLIPPLVEEDNIDLIVMGTVARTGISGMLMGNTAEMVLDLVQCPVLAVKPPEFVSPVKLLEE